MTEPGTKTNGYAVDVIENEGIGYAVQHYIGAEAFKDPETRRMWAAADKALTDLAKYLSDETGREVQ